MPDPAPRREVYAWGMYDFANSAFTTSIVTAIYSYYYCREVGGTTRWACAVSIAAGLVFLAAPVVGAICDVSARKKRFAAFFWLLGCAATAALYFVKPGMALFGAGAFIVGFFAFESSVAVTNAFLPELSPPERTNRDSGIAWAMGYVGGGLCLAVNLAMYERGLQHEGFLAVAAWWFVFALPFFLFVRERATPRPHAGSVVAAGFGRVFRTLREVRAHREMYKFMIAFLLLSAGLFVILAMAGPFAQTELGMEQKSLILLILMIQAVAAPGALLFGRLADRFGGRRVLLAGLLLWVAVCACAYFVRTQTQFWFIGGAVALVMGGTQSVSRALVARLAPPEQVAEFYGLFAVFGRLAEAVGPLAYAGAIALTGNPRGGILSTGLFFLAGLGVLWTVRLPNER